MESVFFHRNPLLVSGLFLGIIDPQNGALWGAATGFPIVILSIIEGGLQLNPHNLFFLELVVYVLYTWPAIIGGLVGSFIIRRSAFKISGRGGQDL